MMRRAGVLVVSVLLALLTGCEPGDGDAVATPTSTVPGLEAHTDVLELVRAADDAAKRRGTALFALSDGGAIHGDGDALPRPDGAPHPGAAPRKPIGAGRLAYRDGGVDILVRTLQREENIEFRAVGDAVFVQPIGRLVPIARGMPWVRLAAMVRRPLPRILGPEMVHAPSIVDPTHTFDLLVAAGTIVSSERAMLGDTKVTQYDIELDIERLAEHIRLSSAGQPRAALLTALRTLVDQGTTTAPVTLLLDRHDLPRRVRLLNIAALPTRGPDAEDLPMLTVNYRDWGKPVAVAPPPPGSVATVPR
ncbi:hypothetical protein [Haloechinothrix salitolerans]|uniref:Sporulation and spore germination n=1 Tax=Haloechinothrix salitolerans TaxID=926830 RepID=A0ABW2BYB3_9PSEU